MNKMQCTCISIAIIIGSNDNNNDEWRWPVWARLHLRLHTKLNTIMSFFHAALNVFCCCCCVCSLCHCFSESLWFLIFNIDCLYSFVNAPIQLNRLDRIVEMLYVVRFRLWWCDSFKLPVSTWQPLLSIVTWFMAFNCAAFHWNQ